MIKDTKTKIRRQKAALFPIKQVEDRQVIKSQERDVELAVKVAEKVVVVEMVVVVVLELTAACTGLKIEARSLRELRLDLARP